MLNHLPTRVFMGGHHLCYLLPYPLPGFISTTLPEPYPKSKNPTRPSLVSMSTGQFVQGYACITSCENSCTEFMSWTITAFICLQTVFMPIYIIMFFLVLQLYCCIHVISCVVVHINPVTRVSDMIGGRVNHKQTPSTLARASLLSL